MPEAGGNFSFRNVDNYRAPRHHIVQDIYDQIIDFNPSQLFVVDPDSTVGFCTMRM
jgi:hypothetical protein